MTLPKWSNPIQATPHPGQRVLQIMLHKPILTISLVTLEFMILDDSLANKPNSWGIPEVGCWDKIPTSGMLGRGHRWIGWHTSAPSSTSSSRKVLRSSLAHGSASPIATTFSTAISQSPQNQQIQNQHASLYAPLSRPEDQLQHNLRIIFDSEEYL